MRSLCLSVALLLAVGVGACSGSDDDEVPECGNLRVESGEMCDGALGDTYDCSDLGLGQGNITCNAQCQLDFTGCVSPPTCGNDLRDAGEACDGTNLGDLTCGDLGYDLGSLSCLPNCAYDLSACCLNGCTGEGDTRCLDEQIQTCTEQASGCLVWQESEDCAALSPAHVCDATSLGAQCVLDCQDGCVTVGEQRCDAFDTTLETCALQASGCLDWEVTEDCSLISATASCRYAGAVPECVGCLDDCSVLGTTSCVGEMLRECVEVVTGCFEIQDVTDCALQGLWCSSCLPGQPLHCFGGC